MIAKAIFKNGGIFIPNVQKAALRQNQEVSIRFEILEQQVNDNIFKKTAGLLKQKKVDPIKFQNDQRNEWSE